MAFIGDDEPLQAEDVELQKSIDELTQYQQNKLKSAETANVSQDKIVALKQEAVQEIEKLPMRIGIGSGIALFLVYWFLVRD
jgi:hypothetical protein